MSSDNKPADQAFEDLDKTISVGELNEVAEAKAKTLQVAESTGQVKAAGSSSEGKKKMKIGVPKAKSDPGEDDFQKVSPPKSPAGSTGTNKGAKEKPKKTVKVQGQQYQPRQVNLVVARIEPWTVMKVSFLLSVCFGIAMILASILVWMLLNSMHVFSSVETFIHDIDPTGTIAELIDYIRLPRVVALSTITAIGNVLLMTALSTIGAILYNLSAALVGGVKLSLMDD